MKTILLICVMCFIGCAIPLSNQERLISKNKIAVLSSWANLGSIKNYVNISVVVANPEPDDIFVIVTCEDKFDGELLGVSDDTKIEAGMKRTVMVRGFVRGKSVVSCDANKK